MANFALRLACNILMEMWQLRLRLSLERRMMKKELVEPGLHGEDWAMVLFSMIY